MTKVLERHCSSRSHPEQSWMLESWSRWCRCHHRRRNCQSSNRDHFLDRHHRWRQKMQQACWNRWCLYRDRVLYLLKLHHSTHWFLRSGYKLKVKCAQIRSSFNCQITNTQVQLTSPWGRINSTRRRLAWSFIVGMAVNDSTAPTAIPNFLVHL